ncbi:S-layer homology domain-containing protein [bacterium]|nr:S-layer homology domain-containing protein [bacterium]
MTSNLLPLNTKTIDYTDIGAYPAEVKKALQFLYTYDIMKGFDGKFSPDKDVL